MKITINHNGFHGYSACTINVAGQPGERVQLSAAQCKKLDRAACGSSECKCGESILVALMKDDFNWYPGQPAVLTIPEVAEIDLRGNYPQN